MGFVLRGCVVGLVGLALAAGAATRAGAQADFPFRDTSLPDECADCGLAGAADAG